MSKIKCCHNCPDRKFVNGVRCHSWCERYNQELEQHIAESKKANKKNFDSKYYVDTVCARKDSYAKYRKRRGRRT